MATVEKAASDRSMCKKCNEYIDKGQLRVGPSFGDWGNPWYHLSCVYPSFFNISNPGQIGGYDSLSKSLQARVDSWLKKVKPEKKQTKTKKKKQEDSDEDSGPDDGTQSRKIEQSVGEGKPLLVTFAYDSLIVEELKKLVPASQRSFSSGASPHWTIQQEAAHCLKPLIDNYGFHVQDSVLKLINKKPTASHPASNNNNQKAPSTQKGTGSLFSELGCSMDLLDSGKIVIKFKYSQQRVEFLKNTIPVQFRTYEKEEQRWVVDPKGAAYLSNFQEEGIAVASKVSAVIELAKKSENSTTQNSFSIVHNNTNNNNANNTEGRTISLDSDQEQFILKFNYSKELVELVKKIFPQQDRHYNAASKNWTVDVTSTEGIHELLSKHNFVAQPEVLELLKDNNQGSFGNEKEIPSEMSSLPLKRKSEDAAQTEDAKKRKEE